MEKSSLMFNSYYPYGGQKSDIGNLIEIEKKVNEERQTRYNMKKTRIVPRNFDDIFSQITFVLNATMVDIIEKNDTNAIFSQERWTGIAYILIAIYIAYFISTYL